MNTPELMLESVTRASDVVREASIHRRVVMAAALGVGIPVEEIADAAGLTPAFVRGEVEQAVTLGFYWRHPTVAAVAAVERAVEAGEAASPSSPSAS